MDRERSFTGAIFFHDCNSTTKAAEQTLPTRLIKFAYLRRDQTLAWPLLMLRDEAQQLREAGPPPAASRLLRFFFLCWTGRAPVTHVRSSAKLPVLTRRQPRPRLPVASPGLGARAAFGRSYPIERSRAQRTGASTHALAGIGDGNGRSIPAASRARSQCRPLANRGGAASAQRDGPRASRAFRKAADSLGRQLARPPSGPEQPLGAAPSHNCSNVSQLQCSCARQRRATGSPRRNFADLATLQDLAPAMR